MIKSQFRSASGYLLEGLTILKNRGYDSAGVIYIALNYHQPSWFLYYFQVATVGPGDLKITKFASRDSTSDCIDLGAQVVDSLLEETFMTMISICSERSSKQTRRSHHGNRSHSMGDARRKDWPKCASSQRSAQPNRFNTQRNHKQLVRIEEIPPRQARHQISLGNGYGRYLLIGFGIVSTNGYYRFLVIAQLIGIYLDQGFDTKDALSKALSQ